MRLTQLKSPVFVIGPAHAGKSELAMQMLRPDAGAVVVGTADLGLETEKGAIPDGVDPWIKKRVAHLRELRPVHWESASGALDLTSALAAALAQSEQVLVDAVNHWLAALVVDDARLGKGDGDFAADARVQSFVDEFLSVVQKAASKTRLVIVSSEIGAGPPAPRAAERIFRRLMGVTNQKLAERAATVVQVTAGIPIIIKGGV